MLDPSRSSFKKKKKEKSGKQEYNGKESYIILQVIFRIISVV